MRHILKHITLPDQGERDAYCERGDCTVVAVAGAAGLPYSEAHTLLAKAGRKSRKGFTLRLWLDNQCILARMHSKPFQLGKYKVNVVPLPDEWEGNGTGRHIRSITLARFLRDFPKGRFILRKRSHAFAVIDGQVLNATTGVRTRITNIWHLTEA